MSNTAKSFGEDLVKIRSATAEQSSQKEKHREWTLKYKMSIAFTCSEQCHVTTEGRLSKRDKICALQMNSPDVSTILHSIKAH